MSNETDKLLDLQIEVIQISIYCDIVKNLLLKHRSISVIKIISFSFDKKLDMNFDYLFRSSYMPV